MTERFEVNGVEYEIGKLDPRKQWHIIRRVAPFVKAVVPVWQKASVAEGGTISQAELAALILPPLMDSLSNLSDETSDYLMETCLAVVRRPNNSGSYIPFMRGGRPFFDADNDLFLMLSLTAKVIAENLGGFLSELRSQFPQFFLQPVPADNSNTPKDETASTGSTDPSPAVG